jgi:hypothetical protein
VLPTWYNGLNLRRSIGNPNSLFEQVRNTLAINGPMDRQAIFRSIGKKGNSHTGLFQYMTTNGFLRKVGKRGRYVLYDIGIVQISGTP